MAVDSINLEKGSSVHLNGGNGGINESVPVDDIEAKLEKQTVMKLDLLLVPMMCAIYLLAFLDRANIGNARVAGLQEDLELTDHQYQTGELKI